MCDYTGLSYEKLRGDSGIPWPCDDEHPNGRKRLYTDGVFSTGLDACEDYGHDLLTGATTTAEQYRAIRPDGRAFLKAAAYEPAPEQPSAGYPFVCTTGRSTYQFHTRTKTGRAARLHKAAPQPWVELSIADAARLGVGAGDQVRVESARGAVEATARVREGRDGVVFVPFYYDYWDARLVRHQHQRRSAQRVPTRPFTQSELQLRQFLPHRISGTHQLAQAAQRATARLTPAAVAARAHASHA